MRMNIKNIPIIIGSFAAGFLLTSNAFAFADIDESQDPSVLVPELCSLTTSTAAAVTQTELENGTANDTAIFGAVTSTCNSASGFNIQIKADGDSCVFKHETLSNSTPYAISLSAPMVSTTSAPGSVQALSDSCPDNSTGYVNVWSVSAGSVHNGDIMSLNTTITAAGAGELPDGAYSENLTIRLTDI